MKFRNHILLALSCAVLVSCSDKFFEQYPSNTVTEGSFYQNDDDFNQAVRGCYQRLKVQNAFTRETLAYRSDECEEVAMNVSSKYLYFIDRFSEYSSLNTFSDIWDGWYNGIYRCNDVLDHLEGKEITNHDRYKGECLFIRSWFYFNLYRTFGGVPITRTVVSPTDAKLIPRCTDEEMYELLSEDLAEAAELLPVKRDAEVARVTSIAAYGMLAKVHLTFGHYKAAQDALDRALAIDGYGMMPTTEAAFDANNKMNKEILFALYYNKDTDNGHGYWWHAATTVASDIRNPTQAFYSIFDKENDNRYPLVSEYSSTSRKGNNVYAMKKWDDTNPNLVYDSPVGNDFPHLRYADLILMYAEALNGQNQTGLAVDWLNKTRTRAGLPALSASDFASAKDFTRELAAERGREFALEGQRWFDLVRLGMAIERFAELGVTIDQHNLVFPIPQNQIEIVNNPEILWQNVGY